MTAHRNGGAAVVETLAAHGVDTIFGIPGTHNLEIYRHLPSDRHPGGHARATSRAPGMRPRPSPGLPAGPGVVVTTSGPGADQRDDRRINGLRGIAADADAVVRPAHRCRGP